jgi:hypothetical protein
MFSAWAVADRLGVHAVAAHFEWAITQLWTDESVCMRAALELSPGALQRVARSLSAWRVAALEQLQDIRCSVSRLKEEMQRSSATSYLTSEMQDVQNVCKREVAPVSAATLMQWRMS